MIENTIYKITISHDEVINKRIKKTLKLLKNHKGTQNNPLHIIVDGFNNENKELYEISEVRAFFKALIKKYNNLLSPTISEQSIYYIMLCLIPTASSCSMERMNLHKSSLIIKLSSRSIFGADLSSHVGAHAFSLFESGVGIGKLKLAAKNDNDKLLKSLLEGGMDLAKEIEIEKEIYIRVKNWEIDDHIIITVYFKQNNIYSYEDIKFKRNIEDLDLFLRNSLKELSII